MLLNSMNPSAHAFNFYQPCFSHPQAQRVSHAFRSRCRHVGFRSTRRSLFTQGWFDELHICARQTSSCICRGWQDGRCSRGDPGPSSGVIPA